MTNLWKNNNLVKKSYKKWQGSEKKELHLCLVLAIKYSIGCSICRISSSVTVSMASGWSSVNFLLQPIVVDLIYEEKKSPLVTTANRQITDIWGRHSSSSWGRKKKLADNKFLTSAAQWKSTGSNISWSNLIIYKHNSNRFKHIVSINC